MSWLGLVRDRYKILPAEEEPEGTIYTTADDFEQRAKEAGIDERTICSLRSDFEFAHKVIEIDGQPYALGRSS